jgi:flagellar motor switch protein FliN/FliY
VQATSIATQNWLFKKFADRLAAVLEVMAGECPVIRQEPLSAPPDDAGPMWRQGFEGLPGAMWIAAGESDKTEIAQHVLNGAGIDDADRNLLHSTFTETLGKALSGIAQDFSIRLSREVLCATAAEFSAPQAKASWIRLVVPFPNNEIQLAVAVEAQLLEALDSAMGQSASASGPEGSSKTFDLLLDVELPVSVSFGRAQVALKDVIKLTTGSIVELNRSISEPVEVIVNNCVIARGEVVVVEGNFGVRIQQVISRQERLRTLN